ncbi:MAG: MBOAT family protein [Planctomycetes bacterium]|nr:MBOAT family protein [Planctomycetota bacterium]
MLFHTYAFWLFLAVVILLYRALGHRDQNRLLLVASYVFYGAWDWRFLSLIALSTAVDFFVARGIGRSRGGSSSLSAKHWLWVSLSVNLGLLGVFKYYGFFAEQLTALLEAMGVAAHPPVLALVLPVGISFYTFQTLSYTVDVYRGKTEPVANPLDFALYVSFFPQLVAGPIERSTRLLPQIQTARSAPDYRAGCYLILLGLFKKVVIADTMAPIVNGIFSAPLAELGGLEVLVGVYAFAFQVYGDFSGYSAIARGVAACLGFDLMVNFRHPYFATSPSDYWSRWHISLSTWLRDYVYIPLGGSRGTTWKTYRNLMLTMLIGGIWHGAGWTYVAWGALHGVLLCLWRPFERFKGPDPAEAWGRLVKFLLVVLVFHLMCLGYLFFRAQSMAQALEMLALLTKPTMTTRALGALGVVLFYAAPLMAYEAYLERVGNLNDLLSRPWQTRAAIYAVACLALWFSPSPEVHEFIYFQF